MKYTPDKSYFYNEHDFLNYRIAGNGPVSLVLIHGFGASLQNWHDILPYFDHSEFTIVLVDLKGSGFSSKPENSDYSMVEQARIIGDLLKHINISNYYLAGHSCGGAIVLLITINLIGEKTCPLPNGLILLSAAVYKTELPLFVKYLRIPIIRNLLFAALSADCQAEYTLRKIFHDQEKITPDLISRYSFFMRLAGYREAIIQTANQIIPRDFKKYIDRYSEISIRTLAIWGKQDTLLPLSNGVRLDGALQSSRLAIIENCGHNPQEEQPQLVANLMLDFIRKEEA